MPGGLRKRLERVCFFLESEEAEEDVAEMEYPPHLKYLKMFFIQCQNAVQFGSGKNSTESVFVKNMTELRRDVQSECQKRLQSRYWFAGTGLVAAVPLAFLPLVKYWGSSTMVELQDFYTGRAGKLVAAVIGIVTAVCWWLIDGIRKGRRNPWHLQKLCMENEVMGLQSVVLLLIDVPNITMQQILDALEEYAEWFHEAIARCADRYGAEETEAFLELRSETECAAFRQFAGQLIVSGRIGLARAFAEVGTDRNFFREQQRLHMEQELKKRTAGAQVIAFIPLLFLLFAYLIFPFLVASFGQMHAILDEMKQIRFF